MRVYIGSARCLAGKVIACHLAALPACCGRWLYTNYVRLRVVWVRRRERVEEHRLCHAPALKSTFGRSLGTLPVGATKVKTSVVGGGLARTANLWKKGEFSYASETLASNGLTAANNWPGVDVTRLLLCQGETPLTPPPPPHHHHETPTTRGENGLRAKKRAGAKREDAYVHGKAELACVHGMDPQDPERGIDAPAAETAMAATEEEPGAALLEAKNNGKVPLDDSQVLLLEAGAPAKPSNSDSRNELLTLWLGFCC